MLFASLFQKASQLSAARAVQGHDFPPLGSSQWVLFSLLGASQARECQKATTTTTPRKTVQTTFCTVIGNFFHKILQMKCVCMSLQCFPSKHGNLHVCRHKTVPKHHFLQCFQFPCLPKLLKTPLFTMFSSICPCSNAAGQLKHIYKKSFKNIVFTMFLHCFPSKTP